MNDKAKYLIAVLWKAVCQTDAWRFVVKRQIIAGANYKVRK